MSNLVYTHLWEDQGLGVAPFRLVNVISTPPKSLNEQNPAAFNNAWAECSQQAKAYGVNLCFCNSCGKDLTHNGIIQDANGKYFVVGLDCALKTNDSKLITQVEKIKKQQQRKQRQLRAEKKRLERLAKRQEELEQQRERNGGLTDREVELEKEREERLQLRELCKKENQWLIEVLENAYQSDFVESISRDLEQKRITEFSDKCLDILADIYSKSTTGSRRNSKKYNNAKKDFFSKIYPTI